MRRFYALLLAALMLLGAAACGGSGTDAPAQTTASAEPTEATTTVDPTKLPDKDLGGWTFHAFVRGDAENSYWKCVDLLVEDYTGDVLNDSVLDRNQDIEDTYNCKIAQTESGKTSLEEARNYITAGDDTFCIFVLRADYTATLSTEGSLKNLYDLPYVQFDQRWWDQNAVKDLSIGNRLYFTTGDISISTADSVQIPVFNKTVLSQQKDMEDPYQVVRDGKWTVDKMMDMSLKVNADLDGNGTMNDQDKWGYLAYPWGGLFLFFGSGETIVKKGADDLPVLSVFNDRSASVMDLIYKVHGGANPDVIVGFSKVQTTLMSENRCLFTITSMATVRKQFRESVESDIGILPVPKYEESQDRYYCLVVFQDTAIMYSLPKTCPDINNTGFVLEALAQGSTNTLREAYYDKTISYKALRDRDSLEMLDIILQTRTYDLSSAYLWGTWNNYFTTLNNSGGVNQFSSTYAKMSETTSKAIQDTIDTLEKVAKD